MNTTPANEETPSYCEDCGEARPAKRAYKIYCPKHLKEHLPTTPANEWREEFDKEFGRIHYSDDSIVSMQNVPRSRIKDFIQNLLDQHTAHLVESGKYNSDKLWGEGYYKGIIDERNRIEEVFKKEVPPHPMDIEDSVWLKRLLNKAFNHDKNI